jgi:hypothetical protein
MEHETSERHRRDIHDGIHNSPPCNGNSVVKSETKIIKGDKLIFEVSKSNGRSRQTLPDIAECDASNPGAM